MVSAMEALLGQKSLELEKVAKDLEQTRAELEGLRVALADAASSVVPETVHSGDLAVDAISEAQGMIRWLAQHVDFSREIYFTVGGEVMADSRRLHLGEMVTWPLSGERKLTVPRPFRESIKSALLETRALGDVKADHIDTIEDKWEMVSANIRTSGGSSVPAVFLIELQATAQAAMVVAEWPELAFGQDANSFQSTFDASKHFARPILEECDAKKAMLELIAGDRVEVQHMGEWFDGVLLRVEDGHANVQCDVDRPGLITIAPLSLVRLPQLRPRPLHVSLQSHS
mmetsp:Transcript_67786/g.126592  ORF Transcript_67786/g.126592 Transcript_67786/m.126592 type:complete len:286 (-) Transcript_67786:153-1010(-)